MKIFGCVILTLAAVGAVTVGLLVHNVMAKSKDEDETYDDGKKKSEEFENASDEENV